MLLFTQSIALSHAKHCIVSRKALHCLTQSIAINIVLNSLNSRYFKK